MAWHDMAWHRRETRHFRRWWSQSCPRTVCGTILALQIKPHPIRVHCFNVFNRHPTGTRDTRNGGSGPPAGAIAGLFFLVFFHFGHAKKQKHLRHGPPTPPATRREAVHIDARAGAVNCNTISPTQSQQHHRHSKPNYAEREQRTHAGSAPAKSHLRCASVSVIPAKTC